MSQVHQPSNKCTNRIDSNIYLVGAAETVAPPEISAPTEQEVHNRIDSIIYLVEGVSKLPYS